MKLHKYTEQDLRKAVEDNYSIASCLSQLGIKPAGGNYATFRKAVKYFNINTDHFTGQAWNRGKKHGPSRPIEYYLTNNTNINSIKSSSLRERLIKSGYKKHVCENCFLTEWLENSIPLELHHINGISYDNRIENLQLLCPNCHSLTPNYRRRKSSIKSEY